MDLLEWKVGFRFCCDNSSCCDISPAKCILTTLFLSKNASSASSELYRQSLNIIIYPAKCILLLSPWVKTPPVHPASCTDRAIHPFLLEQCGPLGSRILYYGTQSICVLQCSQYVLKIYFSFTALLLQYWTLTSAQSTDRAQCAQGICVLWNSS